MCYSARIDLRAARIENRRVGFPIKLRRAFYELERVRHTTLPKGGVSGLGRQQDHNDSTICGVLVRAARPFMMFEMQLPGYALWIYRLQ